MSRDRDLRYPQGKPKGGNPWALWIIGHNALGHQKIAKVGDVFEIEALGRARTRCGCNTTDKVRAERGRTSIHVDFYDEHSVRKH